MGSAGDEAMHARGVAQASLLARPPARRIGLQAGMLAPRFAERRRIPVSGSSLRATGGFKSLILGILSAVSPFGVHVGTAGVDDGFHGNVGVLCEEVELDARRATTLFREVGPDGMGEGLLALAEAGEAKVIERAFVATRSGQRAKVESFHEFIYPTEYDPEEVGPIKRRDGSERLGIAPRVATAFEMRPVGNVLEVDPSAGRAGGVELIVASEVVARRAAAREWAAARCWQRSRTSTRARCRWRSARDTRARR